MNAKTHKHQAKSQLKSSDNSTNFEGHWSGECSDGGDSMEPLSLTIRHSDEIFQVIDDQGHIEVYEIGGVKFRSMLAKNSSEYSLFETANWSLDRTKLFIVEVQHMKGDHWPLDIISGFLTLSLQEGQLHLDYQGMLFDDGNLSSGSGAHCVLSAVDASVK